MNLKFKELKKSLFLLRMHHIMIGIRTHNLLIVVNIFNFNFEIFCLKLIQNQLNKLRNLHP